MFLWFWPQNLREDPAAFLPGGAKSHSGYRGAATSTHTVRAPKLTVQPGACQERGPPVGRTLLSVVILKIHVTPPQFSHPHCCTSSRAGIQGVPAASVGFSPQFQNFWHASINSCDLLLRGHAAINVPVAQQRDFLPAVPVEHTAVPVTALHSDLGQRSSSRSPAQCHGSSCPCGCSQETKCVHHVSFCGHPSHC